MSLVRVQLWEPKRADDKKSSAFLFALTNLWFVYSLTVNQDGVGERAEIIQSLSQLTLTALFTKESLAIRSV